MNYLYYNISSEHKSRYLLDLLIIISISVLAKF